VPVSDTGVGETLGEDELEGVGGLSALVPAELPEQPASIKTAARRTSVWRVDMVIPRDRSAASTSTQSWLRVDARVLISRK
jgi:hypothetical protein